MATIVTNERLSLTTMSVVLVLLLVNVVCGDVNMTFEESMSGSRMYWVKTLFDHHEWSALVNSGNQTLPSQCVNDLNQYFSALNQGEIWASKMFDSSGQYSSSMLFGNEFWLGSAHACKELQLTQYHNSVPPYPTTFTMTRINLTLDKHHLPQSRIISIGECLPESCGIDAVGSILRQASRAAELKASSAGLPEAELNLLTVRLVPSSYNIFADKKLYILVCASSVVGVLILLGSLYEGYLERKWRQMKAAQTDLETQNQTNKTPVNDNVPHNDENQPTPDNKDKDLRRETCGVWSELLLSFSVLANGRTILSTERPTEGSLTCLHGMRFLSVAWVIMVHTYLAVFYIAGNKTMRTVTERNFMYQSVGNASYCVDTFFFISGLLVTVLFLRTEEKKANKRAENNDKQDINKNISGYTNSALSLSMISQNSFTQDFLEKPRQSLYTLDELCKMTRSFFTLFMYRIIRLTPAYAFVIGVTEISIRHVVSLSVFEPAIFDHITCASYWWRNLLYINNLYPQREMCMVWSWYMANDTQFYVVGAILLLISVKHPKLSMVLLGLVMSTSWITTIYISIWHQYKARIQEPFEMFDPLYDKPWSRIGPYLVGMIVGWYLHKTRCQVRIPYWLVAVGWSTSLAIFGVLIFGMVDGYFEVWPTALYVSVGHTGWGVALAWISIACCCGYGGIINSALSYRGLLPLSRLSYCAYLIHPTIMMYTTFLMDGPYHLQNSMVLTVYAGYAVMAFLSSFAISLAFEAPTVRLLKIINGGFRKPAKQHT